jgi:hypothetical protein
MITLNRPALPAELVERLDAAARPTRHGPTNPHAVAVASSLHMYGADVRQRGTSVRHCYRMPVR